MSFNYISPIQLIVDNYQTTIEDEVMKIVQNAEIVVDKEELINALKYDRHQYEKGYEDGQNTKHGKWVFVDNAYGIECLCDNCKMGVRQYRNQPYCSECGAKMDKE